MNFLKALYQRLTRGDEPQSNYRTYVTPIQAGMNVNHDTAMQFSAVFRAISYISAQLAMMPWRVMIEKNNKKEIKATHPTDRLLHRNPNPEQTPFSFVEQLIAHALSWGNGYAEIERDLSGRAIALWPITPDRVEVKRIEGQVIYEISNSAGAKSFMLPEQIFHLRGPGFDGLVGYSVITLASRSIGLGQAAEQFGASFFQNGTITGMKVEAPEQLSDSAKKNLIESLEKAHKGPGNAFKAIVAEEGVKLGNLVIPPEDAQFLQTRQFQVDDIARWFGLPPHKLQSMEKATFSNIEHQSIEVVGDALQPWATRLEQEANRKLFRQRASEFYTKINLNSLLRGDVKARAEFYREMWNLGVLSVNEIREYEDLNPIPNGEKRFVQLNMTTLDKAGEEPVAPPAPAPAPAETPEAKLARLVCDKTVRRERHRVVDATTRYADNRAGFFKWMTAFLEQHEAYATQALVDAGLEHVDLKEHIMSARLAMVAYYDDRVEYPTQTLTESLTERVA